MELVLEPESVTVWESVWALAWESASDLVWE